VKARRRVPTPGGLRLGGHIGEDAAWAVRTAPRGCAAGLRKLGRCTDESWDHDERMAIPEARASGKSVLTEDLRIHSVP
jgi:hypothetical protein